MTSFLDYDPAPQEDTHTRFSSTSVIALLDLTFFAERAINLLIICLLTELIFIHFRVLNIQSNLSMPHLLSTRCLVYFGLVYYDFEF